MNEGDNQRDIVFSGVGCMFHNTTLSEMCCNENYCLYTKRGCDATQKRKVSRSAKDSALGSLFCMVCSYYIALVINNDSKLPIVLFVGQRFSGSLFCAITLLLCVRETTKGTRVSLSLAYARLVHSAKAPLDLAAQ